MSERNDERGTSPAPYLSLVMSYRNEEGVLPEFIRRSRATLDKLVGGNRLAGFELVFVDDCSTDASLEVLAAESTDESIVVVEMVRRFGVSECVIAGLEIAKGDIAVYMDCDLQDPPELVEVLVNEWLAARGGVDIIHTHRTHRHGESRSKLAFTRFGYRVLTRTSSVEIEAETGDFKLLSRRAVDLVLAHPEKLPFMRGLVAMTGLPSICVDYERAERFDGRSASHIHFLGRKALRYHMDRSLIAFSDYPLKLILFVAVLMSALSTVYLVVVAAQKLLGLYEPGWPALMAAIVFFGALNLGAVGVLGLYVNVIFLETKNRPNYIVGRLYGPSTLRVPAGPQWPQRPEDLASVKMNRLRKQSPRKPEQRMPQ